MKNFILYAVLALVFFSCEKEKRDCPGSTEQSFSLTGFTKIYAGDANTVTITRGDAFSIKAKGCASDLADLDLSIDADHILAIEFKNYEKNRYRVDFIITVPTLISVNLSGAAKGNISGFQGQNSVIRTVLSGASECVLNGAGVNVAVDISGASKLIASGSTESLYGTISGASSLEAYGISSTEVDISVSGNSKAYVLPVHTLFVEASGNSRVYYKGNPVTTHFETSGNGKVIHE
ncbi:MAG: GIN domain-containing protein [Chitinophagaceae bacterium]